MIQAIIFDCFGVLYIDASRHFYEHHIPHYETVLPQLLELSRASDYGLISDEELFTGIVDISGADRHLVETTVRGVHKRNQILLDYAQSLRSQYKLGMCSNIGRGAMDSFFSLNERRELFDAVVLSGEEGITKPHPAIFQLMAERLGVSPQECIMIDDIEENCSGADAAGMRTIRFVCNAQIRRDLESLLQELGHA